MAVSEIARKHGMIGSFMPKPFSNRTGSGAHFHISIGDSKTKNLFHDAKDPQGLALSEMGYHFLGGMLQHARALAAICAPTVNSYKRLVVGRALSGATWAPAYIAYGDNNRTACVRIPGGRLEMRLPDAGCNPYLVSARHRRGGHGWREEEAASGPMNNTNLYEATPEQLAEAGHRPAAAEPARSHHRAGAGRGGAGRAGRGAGRRVHRAEEDGMDRVRAPCVGLGNQPLRGVLLMCGIVGLLLKKPSWDARLGELLVPMLVGMTERGPDSAGLAGVCLDARGGS